MRKFAVGIGSVVCFAAFLALAWLSIPKQGRGTTGVSLTKAPRSASALSSTPSQHQNALAVASEYGKLPLAFEPNFGQANPQAKFLARGAGYELFLTPEESVFVFNTGSKKPLAPGQMRPSPTAIPSQRAILR
ncbi:MAG: hypothetical protein M3P45_01175, partial [Acidobacteriota bacterium]|nr:hypothetical protein [Acidobacteriota bacterium]